MVAPNSIQLAQEKADKERKGRKGGREAGRRKERVKQRVNGGKVKKKSVSK